VREGSLPCRHEGVIQAGETKRAIEWVIASHTGKSQRIDYFVVTGIDVTERHLAEREARAREAELVELHRRYEAGGLGIVVAHEMSQPLSAIANYAEAILTRLAGGNLQLQVSRRIWIRLRRRRTARGRRTAVAPLHGKSG
jgi:C4-dicarboxylate-specific signal transduction histidine kinase